MNPYKMIMKQSNRIFYDSETLLLLYWPIWVAVILFFDIIVSWRAFYYKNGVSDYWMASAFFCPVLDLIIFDPAFILIVSFVL